MLVPTNYKADVKNVNAVIDDGDVQYRLENLEVTSTHMTFSLEVTNDSENALDINVRDARLYGSTKPFSKIYSKEEEVAYTNRSWAMSPQLVNKYYEEKIKAKDAAMAFLAIVGVGLIVNDIVQDSAPITSEDDLDRAIARDGLTALGLLAVDAAGTAVDVSKYQDVEELDYLPEELFVKKQIEPGERYHGKVMFKKSEYFRYYRMILPVKGVHLIFDFRRAKGEENRALRYQ